MGGGFLEYGAEAEDYENHKGEFDDAVAYGDEDACPAVFGAHSYGGGGNWPGLHRAGNRDDENLE